MKVWALWSACVDPYSAHELIGLFARREDAELVKDGLIGNPRVPGYATLLWEDDEDFPDLYVQPHDLH